MRKNYYKLRREQGLCGRCGKVKSEKPLCEECSNKDKENRTGRKDYLKKQGKCVNCGREEATKGFLCLECWGIHKDRNKKYYEKNKERFRIYDKELKEKWLKDGLCQYCGINKRRKGKKICEKCSKKYSAYSMRKYEKRRSIYNKHLEWRDQKKCTCCGDPNLVPGKNTCPKCYLRILNTLEQTRERRNTNHIWKLMSIKF